MKLKSRFLLIPAILATASAMGDSPQPCTSARTDAQERAAALLSGTRTTTRSGATRSSSQAARSGDAQSQAAALLSGRQAVKRSATADSSSRPSRSGDAQAQAAALLAGPQTAARSPAARSSSRASRSGDAQAQAAALLDRAQTREPAERRDLTDSKSSEGCRRAMRDKG